jgi:hypothetical protein
MEKDNKTLMFDTSSIMAGKECKEEEKIFRDMGDTWFH